jgi:hypothetical protein
MNYEIRKIWSCPPAKNVSKWTTYLISAPMRVVGPENDSDEEEIEAMQIVAVATKHLRVVNHFVVEHLQQNQGHGESRSGR